MSTYNLQRSTRACLGCVRALHSSALRPVVEARAVSALPRHLSPPPRSARQWAKCAQTQRGIFSLSDVVNLLPGGNGQGADGEAEVQRFHARKILPYSQKQLYSIVADVPSYSSFIPFCTTSSIVSSRTPASDTSALPKASPAAGASADDRPFDVQAELEVGFGAFSERFVSRVEGTPHQSVKATAVDSPLFTDLTTTWSFTPASASSPHPSASPTPPHTNASSPSASSPSAGATSPSAQSSPSGPTLLSIDLSFCFVSPLHRMASQAFLPKVSELMVDAFEKRCLEVYGKGRA